ncbi:SymE family type I addiction module toxin [Steroidobacter flavus]|uniref:SymE family type I addiction module toxin n=1 Tax=Steroidobacter flavus TaxID=1842136 RepID=A0ABV8T6S2_9GAMM
MATAKCTTSPRDIDVSISSQASEEIDSRQLKIRDFRPYMRLLEGNEPGSRPSLHLQGRWLEKAGFLIGANVRVRVAPPRLVVELVECDADGATLRGPCSRQTRADIPRR